MARRIKEKDQSEMKPKRRITAFTAQIEITPFDVLGRVLPRENRRQIVAFESEMPKAVVDFLWDKVKEQEKKPVAGPQLPPTINRT